MADEGAAVPASTDDATAGQREKQLINQLEGKPFHQRVLVYTRLSGPGWLQGAITLGGGSLAGALYLGVLGGMGLLWVQLLAIVIGVVMLSAISYVTLSTGLRPFAAINKHISPVLGWGWAAAALIASMVWCMPQFALCTAAMGQNLSPGLFGDTSFLGPTGGQVFAAILLLVVAIAVVWMYDSSRAGVKVFEAILKIMVAVVIVAFFAVVIKLAFTDAGLPWGAIFAGFVPDFGMLTKPADGFLPHIAAIGEAVRPYWSEMIVSQQRDIVITAAATAVGINMTFLLPYSMLARHWTPTHRGLAIFDLSTGLLIPYVVVTTCIVVAAASQFHAQPGLGLMQTPSEIDAGVAPTAKLRGQYVGLLKGRLAYELKDDFAALSADEVAARIASLPAADKQMAAMLVKRDSVDLAASLKPLTGQAFSHVIFGIGVVGMAFSTIIMQLLISGFVICEMAGLPTTGRPRRLASLAGGIGVIGPFVWGTEQASFWLAVPTSMFNFAFLPIAYITFLLMMNSKTLMGDAMPTGGSRIRWNALMIIATVLTGIATVWSLWSVPSRRWIGLGLMGLFIAAAVVVHFVRKARAPDAAKGA